MDKRIITFFLASSINDLEYDRLAVGDFVNQLNNIYQSSGVFIRLIKCESDTLDHSISDGGSQAALDDIIRSSDICFVIFWHKAGDVTFHELKVALEASKRGDKPKIVVYFKRTTDDGNRSEEIKEVMRIIDDELLHYHREYSHIDSLKLGIITQLQVHGFVNAEISVKDNAVMCANNRVMLVDRIPLFADNAEYTELFASYSSAVKRCEALQAAYAADNGNYKVYRELGKAVKERDRLKSDLDELSANILDIGNSIASMTVSGKAISENIRRAIKCFDAGDYDGVLEALDPEDIEKNIAELDDIENSIIGERIAIVEEYRMRILALKAQARWSEVHDAYIKATAQVQNRPQMPKTVMYEYAAFLFGQTQYDKCIDVCVALGKALDAEGAPPEVRGRVDDLCGKAFYKIGNYAEAEARLSRSLDIRKVLAQSGGGKLEYAESCADLAKVYYCLNRYAQAEALYGEALNCFDGLGETDIARINTAEIDMCLADLFYQTNRHREAEALFSDSLAACIRLADTRREYEERIADISERLAHIDLAIAAHRLADRYFVGALKTRSALLRKGGNAFASYLGVVCGVLSEAYAGHGHKEYADKISDCARSIEVSAPSKNALAETDFAYYNKTIDFKKIEMLSTQALDIRRELARQNPEAHERAVARACKNLAEYYCRTGELDKAEKYIAESMETQKRLLSFSSTRPDGALAATYCAYAMLYTQKGDFKNAEKMYMQAAEIYGALSFTNELARTYNHLGMMYSRFGKTDKAIDSYFDSLVRYIELYRQSPDAYIDRVINTLANALAEMCPQTEKPIMSELLYV